MHVTTMGYIDNTHLLWGTLTIATVANRKQWPTSSAAGYLMSPAPPPQTPSLLLSHSGEYPCECKHLILATNSPKMIRLTRRITETSEALQMVTNACEFLTNHCEFLTKLTIT